MQQIVNENAQNAQRVKRATGSHKRRLIRMHWMTQQQTCLEQPLMTYRLHVNSNVNNFDNDEFEYYATQKIIINLRNQWLQPEQIDETIILY